MSGQLKEIIWDAEFDKDRYTSCGQCIISRKGNVIGIFRKSKLTWLIRPNSYYEESIKQEFPNQFYKSIASVPRYHIIKQRRKIGIALPRVSKSENNFLFIPKNKNLNRSYYIWDVDKNYEIINHAMIYFDISTDTYTAFH